MHLNLLISKIKSLSNTKRVYLTSNQEICQNKINNNNNNVTTIETKTILLSTAVIILATLISKENNEDQEETSPFECGFDPKTSA